VSARQLDVYDVLEPGRVGEVLRDASPPTAVVEDAFRGSGTRGRICAWCGGPIREAARVDTEVCGVVCRKARWRARRVVSGDPRTRPGARRARGDASLVASGDASHSTSNVHAEESRRRGGRVCAWCAGPIREGARVDTEVCGAKCRKARWRFGRAVPGAPARSPVRRRDPRDASRLQHLAEGTARFCYADPPYPGRSGYYPERQEVDHAELIARLEAGWPDGWALSTSAAALRDVLALCPPGVRVCAWRRRTRPARSRRTLSAWEPLLVVGGRPLSVEAPQELLDVLDYRGRYDAFPGALTGMKPPEFGVWLFRQLGARPGDKLADLFPGSGAITRAWDLYTSRDDRARTLGAGVDDAAAASVGSAAAAARGRGSR